MVVTAWQQPLKALVPILSRRLHAQQTLSLYFKNHVNFIGLHGMTRRDAYSLHGITRNYYEFAGILYIDFTAIFLGPPRFS